MTEIYLGLGSNIDPAHHLRVGLTALEELLGPLRCSSVYEGAAIGFQGDPFWNLVIAADTELSVGELQMALRDIEYAHGRPKNATSNSPRTLDIDILTYGDLSGKVDGVLLPRPEILRNAFVLRPLAELAGDAVHPDEGRTYAEIWAAYDAAAQPLVQVEFQ